MNDRNPIACSLDGGDLRRRLEAIAAVGADALVGREAGEGRWLLRFRSEASVRRRLEDIVAAEAECCSFLDLALGESSDELVLSVAARPGAEAFADGLAEAFGADVRRERREGPRGGRAGSELADS